MRELQACDFCGADAVGVYEPLPGDVADQRRVALCANCRDRLATLLEPLRSGDAPVAGGRVDGESGRVEGEGPADNGEASPPTADDADEADATEAEGDDADGDRDAGGSESAPAEDRPPGYGKVLRLLENREAALPRDAVETMAMDAYDLGPGEVKRVVDAALENGDLREEDGDIRGA